MEALKDRLVAEAADVGFDLCRICRPWDVPQVPERLAAFLDAGYHGQMGWLADRSHWRGAPQALWPEARSVVMLGESYAPGHDPLAVLDQPEKAAVSVYAQNRDYHDVVKKRLKRSGALADRPGPAARSRSSSIPPRCLEKPLGQAAGLGWQGKHTNLVSRDLGSWFFLGVGVHHAGPAGGCAGGRSLRILPGLSRYLSRPMPFPRPISSMRGAASPTSRSSITGPVDPELRALMGNRIYGCDDCLAVCPWNKFAVAAQEVKYHARDRSGRAAACGAGPLRRCRVPGAFLGVADQADRARPVRAQRALRHRQFRDRPRLRPVAQGLCDDDDPTVADAARWAVAQRLA